MIKKVLQMLKKKLPEKRLDPIIFMSNRKLRKEIKRLRKRNHDIAGEWSKRYSELMQDMLMKQSSLSLYKRAEKNGWEYLKQRTADSEWGWSSDTRQRVGILLQQLEYLLEMLKVKDKLLKTGRRVVADLNLHTTRSKEEESALDWLEATAGLNRPIFENDVWLYRSLFNKENSNEQ